MKSRASWTAGILGLLLLAGAPARGAPADTSGTWKAWTDAVAVAGSKVIANLPADLTEQETTEAHQMMVGALFSAYLSVASSNPKKPEFVPTLGFYENFFGPNPDTIYLSTLIDGMGSYRLRGNLGQVSFMNLSIQQGPYLGITGKAVPHQDHEFAELHPKGNGDFEVLLSADRPPGYKGDWWRLDAKTERLQLRYVSQDWAHDRDPTVYIERLDTPPAAPPSSVQSLYQGLNILPAAIENSSLQFAHRMEEMEKIQGRNRMFELPIAQLGGMDYQRYVYAAIVLPQDGAVVLETDVPKKCLYWSLLLTNWLDSTLDWVNYQSSLNSRQAHVDPDGKLRVVISDTDPGVANWMDTVGHRRAGLQLRWTGCDSAPIPTLREVAKIDLRNALPRGTPFVTPAERENVLQERRAAALMRKRW